MPIADGQTPGANGGADNEAGKGGNDDASKTSEGKGGDKAGESKGDKKADDPDDEKSGQVTFGSQKELDDLIARRVNRATKKLEDDAKLTNEQRLEKERDDAKAEVRERDIRDDFVAKADVSPAIALRLYKAYKDELDLDDSGNIKNFDEVLKTAKKEMPGLFGKQPSVKAGGGDGSAGTGGEGKAGGDMNAALRRMAGRGQSS